MNQEQPQIKVGDRVHWTHVGNNKRVLSMQRREGAVSDWLKLRLFASEL